MDIEQSEAQAELNAADEAIRRARNDEIALDELLQALSGSKVVVPIAGSPGATWLPATVTTRDGTFLVVAFTQTHLAAAFCHGNRDFPRAMLFDLRWVLDSIPQSHGILLNMGSDNVFEWEAPSVAAFREKLRQAAS